MTGPSQQFSESTASSETHPCESRDMVALIEELEAFVDAEADDIKPEFSNTYEVSCLSCS
jgi:hypothetical protein